MPIYPEQSDLTVSDFFKGTWPTNKEKKSYGSVRCKTDAKLLPEDKLLTSTANFSCARLRFHLWRAVICDRSHSPDYPPYYPPRLSRRLRIVAGLTRWRPKALVESHLIHSLHMKIKVTCQVKVRPKCQNATFSHFGLSGLLDEPQRAQNCTKCWHMSMKGTVWEQISDSKRSRSRSVTKDN